MSQRLVGTKWYVAVALIVLLGLGTAAALLMRPSVSGQAEGILLKSRNMAYSSTRLEVQSGEHTITLDNADFVPHTFTIDALGIDLTVPASGEDQLTIILPPGTYTFYCDIPGHPEAGMVGELVVD
jgi:plastocyanin